MGKYFIGIDLGGTNIKAGLFDEKMNLVDKSAVPTEHDKGAEHIVEKMGLLCEQMLGRKSLSMDDVAGVGLGSPGPAKYSEGIIERSSNMPCFRNTPIRDMLKERIGKNVVFENDANVACWGEFEVGVGKDVQDMVFFTLGTGIGGGIVNRGTLLRGSGDNAAELGHIIIYPNGRKCNCGQRGCVEAYASASSTARRAEEALSFGEDSSLQQIFGTKGSVTCKDVYEHLANGDRLARRITDETAQALALLCINMLHITEPERIVFAGGMIAAGQILIERIRHYFSESVWTIRQEDLNICFAELGEDAGIVGAAALARHDFL